MSDAHIVIYEYNDMIKTNTRISTCWSALAVERSLKMAHSAGIRQYASEIDVDVPGFAERLAKRRLLCDSWGVLPASLDHVSGMHLQPRWVYLKMGGDFSPKLFRYPYVLSVGKPQENLGKTQ